MNAGSTAQTQQSKRVAGYCRTVEEILSELPPAAVVERFGQHVSRDPNFLRLLAKQWLRFDRTLSQVAMDVEIGELFYQLLTLNTELAVVTCSGTVNGTITGDWYPFGLEHQRFKVPYELMRNNFVIATCLARMVFQGQPLPGAPLFKRSETSAQRGERVMSAFEYPYLLSQHIDRMTILQQIVLMYCSQVHACQGMHADVDHIGAMHHVLYSALQRTEARIHRLLAQSRDHFPWLVKPGVLEQLTEIKEQCRQRSEFSPDKGLERLVNYIAGHARKAS
jgi:hypothetical protein